ncbi:hypothetical protein BGZ61DRAFT_542225 [Ilyonectria robusta]|uniref:uncharacterized protein n=1 Tax=Ilyonectria robusta TaxID=1079257 RepID=UPI001E8D29D0|nr:uncharacterized protein BGZ61DRAFT_542225 [Ilyonectria robusta]KAH8650414.1 hypothetical protein BGZ61DRAFT_542225 [Ilyonectria robusta]
MAEPFEMNPNLPFQDGVSSNYTTNTMGMLNPGYDIPFSTMPDYSTLRGSDSQQAMSDYQHSHSFYYEHATDTITAHENGKGFDEIRLLYPEKDEFVVGGVFYCDRQGCSDSFGTYRDRNKHIREAEKPVVCPYCSIRMPYQSDMKKHAETHQPFLDERSMDDATSACAWRDFHRPRLWRFKLQGTVNFTKLLGYGLDGIVWRLEIGGCVYALKVFWDNHAPEDTRYWAIQRECQNASLLEMIRFAIEHSSDSIWLNPEPKTFHDAILNLHAFSDEGRRRQLFRKTPGVV